jgi:hypothetical protein
LEEGQNMTGFLDVQDALDRILGEGPPPNHGSFWRGVSRDEFVALSVFGLELVVVGDPEASNLVRALRGLAPFGSDLPDSPPDSFIRRMPAGRPPASEEDMALIEGWIRAGCPDEPTQAAERAEVTVPEILIVDDDLHVRYWRAVDDFLHPALSSEETRLHVGRMHFAAFQIWAAFALLDEPESVWTDYLAQPENRESFAYVRLHQRRLLLEFYKGSQDALFDSIWKFGGNLLPEDPLSGKRPQHTMNGTRDWFFWVAHLDATLRAEDVSDLDLGLARGWQVGIVADGLLRTDADRPPEDRIPIPDFDPADPDLKQTVSAAWSAANPAELQAKMLARARDFPPFG